jgi:hypothetical protein
MAAWPSSSLSRSITIIPGGMASMRFAPAYAVVGESLVDLCMRVRGQRLQK